MQNPPETKNSSVDKTHSFKSAAKTMLYRTGIGVTVLFAAVSMVATGKMEYDMDKAIHEKIKQKHLQEQLSREQSGDCGDEEMEAIFRRNAADWDAWTDTTGVAEAAPGVALIL